MNISNMTDDIKLVDNHYYVREINKPNPNTPFDIIKRLFDLTISFIGIVFCIIPGLIIALSIKIDSKGPVFYKQERLGRNGKPFMMIKFRSMKIDAEAAGATWAETNDDRCTRIGTFLRKTRLDEIPQLLNILCGQMSLVGPRPERAVFYREFAKYIDGFEQRLYVIPGLTGYAQINGGYDLKPEEKIIYDIRYIENRSILMDIKILLKTIIIVFSHEGAR